MGIHFPKTSIDFSNNNTDGKYVCVYTEYITMVL